MRIPGPDQLSESDFLFLYEHDRLELNSGDPRANSHRMYVSRFEAVLAAVERCAAALGRGPGELAVLDVGCAQGNFSLTLAERGYRVFAVDLRPGFLRYARLKYERGRVHWVNASADALPFRGLFDIVLLGEVIEHVAHPDALLERLGALLGAAGLLIVTTPNGDRLLTHVPTLSQVADRSSLEARQFQPDADGHLYLLTWSELAREAGKAGLREVYHEYFATPWVTGRIKFRLLTGWLPLSLTAHLDRLCLAVPALAKRLAEGQLVIAARTVERAA
ncbi:MAG TPA: methyltransferase domain-containing protein [Methylomirabilota bacterium]|nr:methyltransferase domain-containing protein [Methylomirabilota bacterium]